LKEEKRRAKILEIQRKHKQYQEEVFAKYVKTQKRISLIQKKKQRSIQMKQEQNRKHENLKIRKLQEKFLKVKFKA